MLWLRLQKAARNGAKILTAQSAAEARTAVADATAVALIWDGVDPKLGSSYAQAFADLSGLTTYVTSEQANARGAEAMGMLPGLGPDIAGRAGTRRVGDVRRGPQWAARRALDLWREPRS